MQSAYVRKGILSCFAQLVIHGCVPYGEGELERFVLSDREFVAKQKAAGRNPLAVTLPAYRLSAPRRQCRQGPLPVWCFE